MSTKRKHLDAQTAREWSDIGHLAFIESITSLAILSPKQFAFHGGTSLHLSWNSPRFSEDLDFLLDRSFSGRMGKLRSRIESRMKSILMTSAPGVTVRIEDKTRDGSNLINWRVKLTSPDIIGQAMVKAEFWQVDEDYLAGYKTAFAYPMKPGDVYSKVSQPLPAATLEAAYADKLTAFATRPHLKWRDLFDLWWLGRNIDVDVPSMSDRFLHHITAYSTQNGMSPTEALRDFLSRDVAEIAAAADPDLKNWLKPSLWAQLQGQGIRDIVDDVRARITAIADHIEAHTPPAQEQRDDREAEETRPDY